ncbi:hypothetical protein Arub01_04650 [Actinomadura rubrobrunea]|uniref:Uncharacterized protein n=1 Tax=Actinomadura rubrobrunea TaxID=115335 RepID=A0A9W6US27_9ACTN|nr:hypothetical protein Arub01_04650 [Actinomadura rubrobrunea]
MGERPSGTPGSGTGKRFTGPKGMWRTFGNSTGFFVANRLYQRSLDEIGGCGPAIGDAKVGCARSGSAPLRRAAIRPGRDPKGRCARTRSGPGSRVGLSTVRAPSPGAPRVPRAVHPADSPEPQ